MKSRRLINHPTGSTPTVIRLPLTCTEHIPPEIQLLGPYDADANGQITQAVLWRAKPSGSAHVK